ncbi:MAG: helix-turn-helix transcriptional regulator [Pseudomonadota bacterium]
MNTNYIGKRVLTIRKKNNLTQEKFSKLAGVVQSYLAVIEKDKKTPSFNFIMSILDATKVSADWLLTGKGSMYLPIKKGKPEIKGINKDRIDYGTDNSSGLGDVLDALKSHWGELRNDQKKVLMVMLKEMIENNEMRKENYKIREFINTNAATKSGDSLQIPSLSESSSE